MDGLLGRPVSSLTVPGVHPSPSNAEGVRAVLLRSAIPASSGHPAPDLSEVGQRVAQAWSTWHSSPDAHAVLGGVLPGLLTDALACHEEAEDKRASARVLSGAWQVTRQWLHHLPEGDLAWIAAERAMVAAREADDPQLIALAAWALSAPYRRAGQPDEATRLCLAAGDVIAPLLDTSSPDPGLLAAYGMLHLAAAVSAAQSDEDGRAWALHRVADRAARALGSHYDPWTAFCRANVDIHAVAVHAALGDANAIVDNAARLDLTEMPSPSRRAAALIDIARGFVRRGEDEAAALVLLDAEQTSADRIRHSTLVREMVRELLHRDRARARAHVRGLAQRIGLLAAV